jgi:hypothetical protein
MAGSLVSDLLQRSKLFLRQPTLEKKYAMYVTVGFVIVVDGCDKLKVSA